MTKKKPPVVAKVPFKVKAGAKHQVDVVVSMETLGKAFRAAAEGLKGFAAFLKPYQGWSRESLIKGIHLLHLELGRAREERKHLVERAENVAREHMNYTRNLQRETGSFLLKESLSVLSGAAQLREKTEWLRQALTKVSGELGAPCSQARLSAFNLLTEMDRIANAMEMRGVDLRNWHSECQPPDGGKR